MCSLYLVPVLSFQCHSISISIPWPQERLHERLRSGWDQLWWEAHEAMCKESPAACRISCA